MISEPQPLDDAEQAVLSSLLRLIDDPDETIGSEVVDRLMTLGPRITSHVRAFMNIDHDATSQRRAASVIHAFQQRSLDDLIRLITMHRAAGSDIDLEDGVFLLDGFGNPGADSRAVHTYIDELALRTHEEFITMVPANDLTQLLAIHNVLFEEEAFHGATENYHDPSNSYISSVIQRREGIPISLCVVELMLADRAGLDLRGVAMPYHFVLYSAELDLFIDPYRGGILLQREECRAFIETSGLTFRDDMLLPVGNIDIIIRMMRNLAYAHAKAGQEWEATILHQTLENLQ